MSGGDSYLFWLGASADADPATRASHRAAISVPSRPCGGCPLRGAIEEARAEILSIPLEVVERHLDRAYAALCGDSE